MPTFDIRMDLSQIDSLVSALGKSAEDAARPAAQAAAQVFYDEVRRNVAKIGKVTGNLSRSIYQKHIDEEGGPGRASYRISWRYGRGFAPHGHLIEFGHVARYATYVGKDGRWHTAVRPDARGKRKPGRNATQAQKDAYYVLRKNGPKQIAAQPFVRPALAKTAEALAAMEGELWRQLVKGGLRDS